jgi:hypothetical protein
VATKPIRIQPPDESGDLSAKLWIVAESTATAHGIRFEPGCAQLTQQLLRAGASTLKGAGKHDERDAISQALHNTVRYVELMIADAQAGNTPNELHEYNFGSARTRFCPCFPFC